MAVVKGANQCRDLSFTCGGAHSFVAYGCTKCNVSTYEKLLKDNMVNEFNICLFLWHLHETII